MHRHIAIFILVGVFVSAQFARAQMNSTNYRIRWDTVSTGGSEGASSTSYTLRETLEPVVAGTSTSASFQLTQGYRVGVNDLFITFDVRAQDTSSRRDATGLSSLTVTASTTGIVVDDLIALVQDVGASQVAAIGRVASLGSGTITVDEWKNAGTQPTIDGINDAVYLLTGASVGFGRLETNSVDTALLAFEVNASNDNGYVVQIADDGNLRSGANDINDVADGLVSLGVEEYGGRSSDTSLTSSTFDTADSALTTSFQDVATESAARYEHRNFVTLKAAISSSTTDASYAHIISVIVSGNF